MHVCGRALLRLVAGASASLLAFIPLTVGAADLPSVDALWSQPGGIGIDSPLYPLQSWWNGWNQQVPNDPTQRGLGELNQANIDLFNAYTLLQKEHASGADPVPIVDPLLSSVYDAITGSNARAPLGSLGNWVNESLLKLEGRDSSSDLVQRLLQEYRDKQAVAVRDLHVTAGADGVALLQANAQREADFITRVAAISSPEDGVATLLADASSQTKTLSVHGQLIALTHGGSNNGSGQAVAGGNAGNGNVTAGGTDGKSKPGSGHDQGKGQDKGKSGNPPEKGPKKK